MIRHKVILVKVAVLFFGMLHASYSGIQFSVTEFDTEMHKALTFLSRFEKYTGLKEKCEPHDNTLLVKTLSRNCLGMEQVQGVLIFQQLTKNVFGIVVLDGHFKTDSTLLFNTCVREIQSSVSGLKICVWLDEEKEPEDFEMYRDLGFQEDGETRVKMRKYVKNFPENLKCFIYFPA